MDKSGTQDTLIQKDINVPESLRNDAYIGTLKHNDLNRKRSPWIGVMNLFGLILHPRLSHSEW